MDSPGADGPRSNEDLAVKKKSRFQILKTRLFGRIKRKDDEGSMTHTQSASDITAPECHRDSSDSLDDFVYSPGTLGSRALSHDSIFLTNQSEAPPEPERILSQENVHGKIRALQMKLQQNIRLGPPPMLIPTKRTEDTGACSEDDGLPHSPPDVSLHEALEPTISQRYPDSHRHHSSLSLAGTGSEEDEQSPAQPPSHLLSPVGKPSPKPSSTEALSPVTDFDVPARFIPCLDNSAARHRMSVKPRNQRASTKGRKPVLSVERPRSESLNTLEKAILEREQEGDEVPKEAARCRSYSTQMLLESNPERREQELEMETSLEFPKTAAVSLEQPVQQVEQVAKRALLPRPVPRVPESNQPAELSPAKVLSSPGFAELPGTPTNKPQSPSKAQGTKDLVKEILQNSGQRYSSNYPITPKTCASDYTPPKNTLQKQGDLGKQAQEMIPAIQLDPSPNPQLSTVAPTKNVLQSGERQPIIPKTSLPKKATPTTMEQCVQEDVVSGSAQRTSAPPTVQDDQQPIEAVRQQRPNSGSFKFSISSAWDRPRTSSFTGGVEGSSVSAEDTVNKTSSNHKLQEPLTARTEEIPLNKQSVTKLEEDLVVKSPSSIQLLQQPVGSLGAAKSKELPWSAEQSTMKKRVTEESVKSGQVQGKAGGGSEVKEVQESKSNTMPTTGEEDTQGRTSFGVKLRSTSLSLRYRSDIAQSEQTRKGRSAEVGPPSPPAQPPPAKLAISEELRPRAPHSPRLDDEEWDISTDNINTKPPFLRKPPSQNPDRLPPLVAPSLPPSTLPREKIECFKQGALCADTGPLSKPVPAPSKEGELATSEPVWMSVAREKTRSLQQIFTCKLAPLGAPQGISQRPPQPVARDREEKKLISHLGQEGAPTSSPMERKVDTEAAMESRSPLMPKKAGWPAHLESKTELRKDTFAVTTQQRPLAEGRCEEKAVRRAPVNVHFPEVLTCAASEAHADKDERWRKRSELQSLLWSSSPSSSPSAPPLPIPASGAGQPSWLELAKRKSLAWSDKTVD
ncbi:CRACD-like protein isoform X2 [Brienomyrus brachyistius]|nr:CRACD-like protein isoform X2 [Brienomyrus brachyistius]XP_048855296.1 CRACD-like protein isoform X2 [Brienomyrus brachyistius]XP_048855297.1 CRACD-like protein isoform X2 [Brienomyrus brachyistius]XP_048855298.1 CRACD-like protein isoform X2 [Brienomyrus brachyistius]